MPVVTLPNPVFEGVDNAIVQIKDNMGTVEILSLTGNGIYATTSLTGIGDGRTYFLEVNIVGKIFKANSIMPIDTLPVAVNFQRNNGICYIRTTIYTIPNLSPDYFLIRLYRNSAEVVSNYWYGNNFSSTESVYSFQSLVACKLGDLISVKAHNVPEYVIDFIRRVQYEKNTDGGVFSSPPSNVVGNIEGEDGFGLFYASNLIEISYLVK